MISLLFFRGHGVIPVLVRLFTWKWFYGQKWKDVPAHVAVMIEVRDGVFVKYEAIVSGIESNIIDYNDQLSDKSLMAKIDVYVPDVKSSIAYLDSQLNDRYGFEAVAINGIAAISPFWIDLILSAIWRHLMNGQDPKTCPLHCSMLAFLAVRAGGKVLDGREDGMPSSPNDLLRSLRL